MQPGTVLAGKYRLESLIGRGGMGSVWRAAHLGLDAPVAVKLLDSFDGLLSRDLVQRFYREARAAASIRSPHVVQILDHGLDEASQTPFIIMELMEGESLAQRLRRVGRLTPSEAAHVFTHVARALTRAHEAGIVHRDLKPDNVFLVHNEDEIVAKVLDFGIAKVQAREHAADVGTRTGMVMGTAYYMSPEQIAGDKDVDFRTDLWAFGVMACECLTGHRPFEGDSVGALTLKICVAPMPAPSALGPVPPSFDAWFFRIVNRSPSQRFPSAREAADTLRGLLTGQDFRAPIAELKITPPPAPYIPTQLESGSLTTAKPLSVSSNVPPARTQSSREAYLWGGAGLFVLAVALGAFWLVRRGPQIDDKIGASSASPPNSLATAVKPSVSITLTPPVVEAPVLPARETARTRSETAPSSSPEPAASGTPAVAVPKRALQAAPPKPPSPVTSTQRAPAARDVIDDRR